jgi:hypothetical protein
VHEYGVLAARTSPNYSSKNKVARDEMLKAIQDELLTGRP